MQKLEDSEKVLVLDFLTLVIAILSLTIIISAFATMLESTEITNKVFRELFQFSLLSFGSSYLLFQAIKYLLSFKIAFSNFHFNFLWLLTIVLGTYLFTYLAFDSLFFNSFEPFFGCLMVALIPSASFRLTVNFVISYWQEKKNPAKLSIIR
jgi:hypothetical protein